MALDGIMPGSLWQQTHWNATFGFANSLWVVVVIGFEETFGIVPRKWGRYRNSDADSVGYGASHRVGFEADLRVLWFQCRF